MSTPPTPPVLRTENFEQSLREFDEFLGSSEFPDAELIGDDNVREWMCWAWQHGYIAGDVTPPNVSALDLPILLRELAWRSSQNLEARYAALVLGLFSMRAAAADDGEPLGDRLEAQIAGLHEVVWSRLDSDAKARVETIIEVVKEQFPR